MGKMRWTNRVTNEVLHRGKEQSLHYHPFYLVCSDVLSLVGELLSRDGCGSPNHIILVIFFFFTYRFIYSLVLGIKGVLLSS